MRIMEISIDSYGHLDKVRYSLSTDELVVLYGLNEAGKSTLFHFIETVLFGFSRKRAEVEHYSPPHINQYGGYCIIELNDGQIIKVSRYYRQNKGQPTVARLMKEDEQFSVVVEKNITQEELERDYLTSINRSVFRNLCALTLDELQATSMQDDEQLNQHLYHATWESSKLISQLEKRSQDILDNLYRPRGSKQRINMIVAELKQIQHQLSSMENELDAYEKIQQRLSSLQHEMEVCHNQQEKLKQELTLRSKIEQDYPLYRQYQELIIVKSQLEQQALDSNMLMAINQFILKQDGQQTIIDDLHKRREQLTVELALNMQQLNEELYSEQQDIINQYSYIEPLQEDVEAREEQSKKQAIYIKKMSTLGGVQLDEAFILDLEMDHDVQEETSKLEAKSEQLRQSKLNIDGQVEQMEQRIAYLGEKQKRLLSNFSEQTQRIQQLPHHFIPQSSDELIRLETSYDEALRRNQQFKTVSIEETHVRGAERIPKRKSTVPFYILCGLTVILIGSLLLVDFSWLNVLVALLMVAGCVLYGVSLKTETPSSNLHLLNEQQLAQQALFSVLAQLIVSPMIDDRKRSWTSHDDGELRQSLQQYRMVLKEMLTDKETFNAVEKEVFDLEYQLKQYLMKRDEVEESINQLSNSWHIFLNERALPVATTFLEFKLFIRELSVLKDTIRNQHELQKRKQHDLKRLADFETRLQALSTKMNIPFDDQYSFVTYTVKEQYAHNTQLSKDVLRLRIQLEQIVAQLNDRDSDRLSEEHSIRERYPSAQSSSIEQWKTWLAQDEQLEQYKLSTTQLEQQRQMLASPEQRIALERLYASESQERLLEQESTLKQSYAELLEQEQRLLEERGELHERMKRLSSTSEKQALQQQELMLQEQLTDALKQFAKHAVMHQLVSSTREQFEAEHQPVLMKQASKYIAQLTEGRYTKIVLQQENHSFLLATSELTLIPIERLSRGTAELVYFSLRLALLVVNPTLQRAPLILDDPFVNFDGPRQARVITLVHELAKERQIVLLTCHVHIASTAQQAGQSCLVEV